MVCDLRHVALLVPVCLALGGCLPNADSPLDEQKNPYYLAGKERVASRDYRGAIEAFERAIEVNPRSALAHFELGVLYEQRENDYPAAIYHYAKVLKLRPSGEYPAEHAKLRIPACKTELIKADTLTTINPAAYQELERLREENTQLRKQIEQLQAALQARPPAASAPGPGTVSSAPPATPSRQTASPARISQADGSRSPVTGTARTPAPAGATRTHKVKANETLASIARQYGVRLESVLAANPGVDSKRLKIGQTVNIPSS